jgi:uncharacterized FlaG/YvyC family protein
MSISSITNATHPVAPAEAKPAPVPIHLQDQQALIQAVKAVNASDAFGLENQVTFAIDRKSRRVVLRIVNRETGETVGQIPPEDVLRRAEALKRK